MASLLALGGDCTPLRFFEPNEAFFAAMLPFYGLDIVDVGAGRGHVAAALKARGHDVIAIDAKTDGAEFPVHVANAVRFSYPAGAVALFCRPNHGPWFVEPAIERMVECDVAAVIYVGFGKHATRDMGRFRRRFRIGAKDVGGERETFYLCRRPEE